MTPGVFGQVVATHEAAVADVADKLLLARVRSAVAGKLIGACKLFVAALPVAAERLLAWRGREQSANSQQTLSHDHTSRAPTCVCAQVSLQVGALEVRLLAAREVADVVSPAGEVRLRDATTRS